jgi:hypothetical protein
MIGSSSNRHSFKDSLSYWLRMLTPNYTYCAIIKFRWIVLGGRPGLARESEKISTRFEMENKKRKLFDNFAWRDRCEGVLSSGIRSAVQVFQVHNHALSVAVRSWELQTKGALVVNGPSEIKFRDTEMKIHVDGRYLCTMHISRFVPVGRFKKREQDIQIILTVLVRRSGCRLDSMIHLAHVN